MVFSLELTKGELKKKPTDKQLLHFVQNFGIDDFVIFALRIGVSEGVIQNLKFTYQHEPVHIMFMILHHWKSNAASPTFTDLLQGLITTGIIWQGRHLLCNVSVFFFAWGGGSFFESFFFTISQGEFLLTICVRRAFDSLFT